MFYNIYYVKLVLSIALNPLLSLQKHHFSNLLQISCFLPSIVFDYY